MEALTWPSAVRSEMSHGRPSSLPSKRCGASGAHAARLPCLLPCQLTLPLRARRHCNLATMDPVARGNALDEKLKEYCIHGHYKRSESDVRGKWGAWWVPLRVLVRQLGSERVREAITAFEAELAEQRDADLAAAGAESDGDGQP